MDASQHALDIARRVVQFGAAREPVKDLYHEYCGHLKQGARGSFTQLLYVRGTINRATFDQLQKLVPPPTELTLGAAPLPELAETSQEGAAAWGSGVQRVGEAAAVDTSASDRLRVPLDISLAFGEQLTVSPNPEAESTATIRFEALVPVDTHDSNEFQPLGLMLRPEGLAESMDELALPGAVNRKTTVLPIKPPAAGDRFGDYELVKWLGRGGMGVIFLAKGPDGTEVALKLLLASGPTAEKAKQRFEREVTALKRLRHPGLVHVHASGSTGPIHWYAMDYVKGTDLSNLLKAGKLSFKERMGVFVQVCDAIAHAHEHSIIHRDLKPGNVVVTDDGLAVVLDLGLAKIVGKDEITLTRTGATIGTPYYMAPEQLLDPKSVDHRADVFALGVMLYELATGVRPFVGETFLEVTVKVTREPARPPTEVQPDLPAALDAICEQALRKHRDDRTPYVAVLRDAVKAQILAPGPPKAREAKAPAVAKPQKTKSTRTKAAVEREPEPQAPIRTSSGRVPVRRPVSERLVTPKKGRYVLAGVLVGVLLGLALAVVKPGPVDDARVWWKEFTEPDLCK